MKVWQSPSEAIRHGACPICLGGGDTLDIVLGLLRPCSGCHGSGDLWPTMPECVVCGAPCTLHCNGISGCDEHASDVFRLAVNIEAMEQQAPIDDVEKVVAEMLADLIARRRDD